MTDTQFKQTRVLSVFFSWVNSVNISAMRYKKQKINSTQVLISHQTTLRKNAIESIAFRSKSMYKELVTYLLVLVVYFYEFIIYMLLERNSFDSIAFFSQCSNSIERDNFSTMYLSNSYSWNYKLFRNFFYMKKERE